LLHLLHSPEDKLGESGCLIVQPKEGGILHLRLNMRERPIAHKYRKGKMQRTLKREFKELEVVEREANATNCRTTCYENAFCLPRVCSSRGVPTFNQTEERPG